MPVPPSGGVCALCDRCGGDIYSDELVHVIDGFIICADCFEDYAYEYFEDCLMTGDEVREMLWTSDNL